MFRKIVITGVLAVAGLVVLNRAGLTSYGATAWHKLRGSVKEQIPIEFEIERLKYQIAELTPDMKKHLSAIAEEMVATQNLREEVTDLRANLGKQKDRIVTMSRDLDRNIVTVSYGGRTYEAGRVRDKLSRDFASYQQCEAEFKSKEKLLDAKERSLDADRERLSTIRTQKHDLEAQVAQLEADAKTLRLAQAHTHIVVDDSALARCKATLAEIKTRLKVEKQTTELAGEFANDNTVHVEPDKSPAQLSREIKAYFGAGSDTDGKVVERK